MQEDSRGASDATKADEWAAVERPTEGGEELSAHELGLGEEVGELVQEIEDEWSGIGAKEGEGGSSEAEALTAEKGADEVGDATLDGGPESLDDEEDVLDEDVGATTMPLVTSEQEEQQELEEPVPCSDTVKSTLSSPSFWVIRGEFAAELWRAPS